MKRGEPQGSVPAVRTRLLADRPVRGRGAYVLYWMTSSRRTRWSYPLQRAVDWAKALKRPLVVFEPLRCDYPWASHRHHRFILDGMRDNAERLERKGILYYPWVEERKGGGRELLKTLSRRACVVITDDSPAFFYPQMLHSAAGQSAVRMEAVDGNGLYPIRATDRLFTTAASFRRHLQKELPDHLGDRPKADPLRGLDLPAARGLDLPLKRWPMATSSILAGDDVELAKLPIDGSVRPTEVRGGERAAAALLNRFLREKLDAYDEERNLAHKKATSHLSPYLHYGQISSHQVVHALLAREGWTRGSLGEVTGSRGGWWGVSGPAEAFLDQVVTWRELGFNRCAMDPEYDRFESLPGWAQKTLREHAKDPRPHTYSPEEFETARTHDDLWNAAQSQLVTEGTIHNYLRMLWGKKILEWSATPRKALDTMIHLNNKYALDGRDPNSYSGIFWCLGRFDRAWGPERKIFGKVRYMSSDSTRRKMPVAEYLGKYGEQPGPAM